MTSSCFYPTTFIEERLLVVEAVIAWKGKSMGKEIRIGQRPIFEKRVLTSLARKMAKNVCHSARHPRFSIFFTFWEQLEFFLCYSFHVFGCWLHFSHGWEVVFVVLGTGLFSPCFWAAGAFSHSRFFCEFMCFYHGWEEPFPFLTVSAIIGLTHRLFGTFFPCCELCSQISFRTVRFSPTLWVVFAVMYGAV